MTHRGRRAGRAAMLAVTSATVLAVGTPAIADEDDGEIDQPPGYEAPPAPEIDSNAPGLLISDGAELAEPEALDIKSVIESLGTGETEDDDTGDDTGNDDGGTGGDTGGTGGGETEEPVEDGGGEQREEISSGQHKFTLQTDVLFAEGSATLGPDAEDALMEVAEAIDEYQPTEVNIFGFTDDQGSYESGVTLSNDRARNTQVALVDLLEDPSGISFNVAGYSEDFPLYDNRTEEGRERNRRVEISWPTQD
ncbi:OmpA family protein [Streptomyces sp. B6B3]|uniref:OmpA family protein n=1 Tax=Streptomyces sp. B6B3 TaxID=3153570 RepID=UPI00325D7DE3